MQWAATGKKRALPSKYHVKSLVLFCGPMRASRRHTKSAPSGYGTAMREHAVFHPLERPAC